MIIPNQFELMFVLKFKLLKLKCFVPLFSDVKVSFSKIEIMFVYLERFFNNKTTQNEVSISIQLIPTPHAMNEIVYLFVDQYQYIQIEMDTLNPKSTINKSQFL